MNSTQLRIDYVSRSEVYDLPDHIDCILENDYAENTGLYTDETFKRIATLFLIAPDVSASEILTEVRSWGKAGDSTLPATEA